MSEKVLGFKEKDAYDVKGLHPFAHYRIQKIKLVPVVSIKWLENEFDKIRSRLDMEATLDELQYALLSAAKKEARK